MGNKITPTLESITVRGKYATKETDFKKIKKTIVEALVPGGWILGQSIGDSMEMFNIGLPILEARSLEHGKRAKKWHEHIKKIRYGVPVSLSLTTIEHSDYGPVVEIECKPGMYYRITALKEKKFDENDIQEALLECRKFAKEVLSLLKGKEIEPVSVYPIIQRREIRDRLLNLGLKEVTGHIDDAERHIKQNNFVESLTCSRTSFEKMVDWEMKKRGLEETNNFKHNLERLMAKGFIDADMTQLLQSYYHYLSTTGVHEKGTPPGFYEAQMGYGLTLIILEYFANKLP